MQEFELIGRLTERLRPRRHDTALGPGDDAAVLAPQPGHELVVTSDTLVAGRHFPENARPADIGFKSMAVNLSDVAAMGAEPAWVTIALTAPELEPNWCDEFVDGVWAAMGDAEVDVVGGDTTRGALSITITALGLLPVGTAIGRGGAKPGDWVCVTGTLGDAALGLRLWHDSAIRGDAARWLHERLCRPQWRRGVAMRGRAHAAIDLSDGLASDLGHILAGSGCGARINADALPTSDAFSALCPPEHRRALQLAGGDDYELCIVVPQDMYQPLSTALECPLTAIGKIDRQPGLRLVDATGAELAAETYQGWDHFR